MAQQDNKPRVSRGGSWDFLAGICRSADRIRFSPSDRSFILGFRVLRSSEAGNKPRVYRGGGWSSFSEHCRSASRVWGTPGDRSYGLGFRVLRSFEREKENGSTR